MVKIMRDLILKKDLQKLWGEPLGVKVKYFWWKGWDEIPEIMAGVPFAILGVSLAIYSVNKMHQDDRPPKYYQNITIFRPDDPRVATIRKDETLIPEKPITYPIVKP